MILRHDRQALRDYLLGGLLAEDQRQKIEERLLTDTDYFEELLLAEDELIDQYVGGSLSAEERSKFEQHFLSTAARHRKLKFAQVLRRYVSAERGGHASESPEVIPLAPRRMRPFVATRHFWLAASVLLVLGLGVVFWRIAPPQSEVGAGLSALKTAYRSHRPLEARITGFEYAPFSRTRGGAGDESERTSLNRAERILLDAVHDQPGPEARLALGRLYLSQRKLDQALEQFERALLADSGNAQAHNDMGVALLERARTRRLDESGQAMRDLNGSLDHLNTAIRLNDSLLEALFNRALVYEYMTLPHQAEEAWRQYLERDSSSQWAQEARERLHSLEGEKQKSSRNRGQQLEDFLTAYRAQDDELAWKLISENREALSRRLISEQLLAAYFDRAAAGEEGGADLMLRGLEYVGKLEASRGGDRFNLGLARFYMGLRPRQSESLAAAHVMIKQGHEHYARADFPNAAAAYGKAKEIFEGAGDYREANIAKYWLGYSHLAGGETQRSLSLLIPLAQVCTRESFKWLLMRTLHTLSSAHFNLNDYSKAIDYCNRSLRLAEQLGDTVGTFNALSVLIEYYRYIGNHDESINSVRRSLPFLSSCPLNPIQTWRHYAIVASSLNSSGLYDAAVEYQREALRLALAAGETSMVCVSYAHLGAIYGGRGEFGEAIVNAQRAFEVAKTRSSGPVGRGLMAYASLQLGNLYRLKGDLGEAVASYDRSIELYKELGFPTHLYQTYKGRLFCHIASGNDVLAEEDLRVTFDFIERYRSTILEDGNKSSFINVEQSVYDLAIDFEHSRRGKSREAFEYSESSRARSLLDMFQRTHRKPVAGHQLNDVPAAGHSPLSLVSIQQSLPERAQILQYAVLGEKILIWKVSRSDFKTVEVGISRRDLDEKVREYLQALSDGTGAAPRQETERGKELFSILVEPIEGLLDRGAQIIIVPDKILNYLPFAAIISPKSNRYFIEDYSLSYSPSSAIFIACLQRSGDMAAAEAERLLSVGDPVFDHAEFPSLTDLPSAASEAKRVASFYRRSLYLTGRNATRARVMKEMSNSDVTHLALHSVVDEHSPGRSKLVLARGLPEEVGGSSGTGVLEAQEIYNLSLPKTRLVVLSACQTGVGHYYGGEGVASIARAFVAAGVPQIVASLWPVDSSSTSELMVNFHRYRTQEKLGPAEALRRAQLDMLRGTKAQYQRPYFWAPFIAIGGI